MLKSPEVLGHRHHGSNNIGIGGSKVVSSSEISSFSAILRNRDYLVDVGSNTVGRLWELNFSNPYNNETLNFLGFKNCTTILFKNFIYDGTTISLSNILNVSMKPINS